MTDDPAGPTEPDEATAVSRRRSIDPDATQPLGLETGPDADPGPQLGAVRHADPSAGEAMSEDGSTIVVRRKSRPRSPRGSRTAARADAGAGAGAATAGAAAQQRIAGSPEANAAYPPRSPEQAEITRRAPTPRPLQAPVDTAAGLAAARRRRRRTALIVVVAASVLGVLAVAGIVALALIP
jgi:hypothetical protein